MKWLFIILLSLAGYFIIFSSPIISILVVILFAAHLLFTFRPITRFSFTRKYGIAVSRINKIIATNSTLSLSVFAIVLALSFSEVVLRLSHVCANYTEANNLKGYTSPYECKYDNWFHVRKCTNYFVTKNCTKRISEKEFTRTFSINSLGLVGKEWTQKSDSVSRLICMGDSFTEGVGASTDSSYCDVLQSLVSGTEVLNAGVAGSDPFFCDILLREKLLAYKPNLLTITINESDITDVIIRGGSERFLANGKVQFKKAPWWEFFYGSSRIVRLIARNIFHLDQLFLTPKEYAAEETIAIQKLIEFTDSFQKYCNQQHIRLVFVFHPLAYEIENGQMKCAPILNHCIKQGYETVNVLSYFAQHGVNAGNTSNYFWPIDKHNKNNGYRLFASAIAAHLNNKQP